MYRPDFQKLLADGAVKAGAKIEYNSAVTDIDVETGSLTLANGSTATADLIVCVDGKDPMHHSLRGLLIYILRHSIASPKAHRATG